MTPSHKSPAIEAAITKLTGVDRRKAIKKNQCTRCRSDVFIEDFRTPLDVREYTISGMCQNCQDKIFTED